MARLCLFVKPASRDRDASSAMRRPRPRADNSQLACSTQRAARGTRTARGQARQWQPPQHPVPRARRRGEGEQLPRTRGALRRQRRRSSASPAERRRALRVSLRPPLFVDLLDALFMQSIGQKRLQPAHARKRVLSDLAHAQYFWVLRRARAFCRSAARTSALRPSRLVQPRANAPARQTRARYHPVGRGPFSGARGSASGRAPKPTYSARPSRRHLQV